MTTKLKDMEIIEGTICPKGKNSLAKIMLFKMEGGDNVKQSFFKKVVDGVKNIINKAMTMDEMMNAKEAQSKWWDVCYAFQDSIRSILEDEEVDQGNMLLQSCMQFIERAKPLAPYLEMNKAEAIFTTVEAIGEDVSKAGKKISTANMQRIKAIMDELKSMMSDNGINGEMDKEGKKKPTPTKTGDDDKSKLKKGDDIVMEYNDVLKVLTPEQSELVKSEIQKQIDSAVKEAITKAQPDNEIKKQLEDVKKDNESLSKALEVLRDVQLTKEFVEKAQGYKGLPVKAEDFGKVLKGLSVKDPENYAELLKVLEAADKLIIDNNTLMKELGSNEPGECDAIVKMNAKAEEIQKANSGMTFEVAFAKAIKENPKLYDQYRTQQ